MPHRVNGSPNPFPTTKILDVSPEPMVDALLAMAVDLFDAPIGLVTLLDDTRQWFKASVGVAEQSAPRGYAFCAYALEMGPHAVMVVEDAAADPRFMDNPLVLGPPNIRFYVGAVLTTADGRKLGTLCLLDTEPRPRPDDIALSRLQKLADLVMSALGVGATFRESRQREALVDLAGRMAHVGHWLLDVPTGVVAWSDEVYRIHGVDRETFDPNLEGALDFYVGDGREQVKQMVATAISDGMGFGHQMVIRRADGELRHVTSQSICEFDANGNVAALVGVFQDVTDQVETLLKSQRDERRYRLLADNMADVVTRIRGDGSSGYISPAITALLGYLPEEMTGKSAQSFVHPDDRWMVTDTLMQLAKAGGSKTLQHRASHKDGGTVWVETHFKAIPRPDGQPIDVVAVIRDISRQKGVEAALAASEAGYRLLTENARDLIMQTALDGRLTYISPSVLEVTGYRAEELLGRQTLGLIVADDVDIVRSAVARQVQSRGRLPPISVEYRGIHKNGRQIWMEARPTLAVDRLTGRMTGITDIVRDITDRKLLEAELRSARAEAESAARTKADFLANMSHELRTPMSSIIGFAGLIASAPELSEQTRHRAKIVEGASRSLVGIVNDILDVSKFEAEGVQFDPQPVDLEDLLIDAARLLHEEARRKGVSLTLKSQRRGPTVLVDPTRLRQVVLNLLGNAVKFTNRGEVCLSLSEDALGRIKISVRDTGIGIAPDRIGCVFERFAQGDGSTSRKFGGTGLGLAICRTIVEAMGGEIGVDSVQGSGSTFWFTIAPPVAEGFASSPAFAVPAVESLQGLRLLLTDDNTVNRELFRALTADCGFKITEAPNGAEAIRAVQEECFDLVLMDVQMPVMDGLEATRMLRAMGHHDLPIIAVTANVMAAQIDQCREAGMTDHLAKPYSLEDVLRIAARWSRGAQGVVLETPNPSAALVSEMMLASLQATIGPQAVERFLGNLAVQLTEMVALLADPEASRDETARIAHSVRGLAGTLGFARVAEAYAVLEHACKASGGIADEVIGARAATQSSLEEIGRRLQAAGLDAAAA